MAGISTGERIPGEVVQAIISEAALGRTISRIARSVGVKWETAKAILERESDSVVARKEALQPIFLRIAQRGALRIEREIDSPKTTFTAAVIAAGVAVDKAIALSPPPVDVTSQHLHLHLQPQDIAGTFNNMLANLQQRTRSLRDAQSADPVASVPVSTSDAAAPEKPPRPVPKKRRAS
jgi:hypothetical protein